MISAKEARERALKNQISEEEQLEKDIKLYLSNIEETIRIAIGQGELSTNYFFYTNNEDFINVVIQCIRDKGYEVKTDQYNINLVEIIW